MELDLRLYDSLSGGVNPSLVWLTWNQKLDYTPSQMIRRAFQMGLVLFLCDFFFCFQILKSIAFLVTSAHSYNALTRLHLFINYISDVHNHSKIGLTWVSIYPRSIKIIQDPHDISQCKNLLAACLSGLKHVNWYDSEISKKGYMCYYMCWDILQGPRKFIKHSSTCLNKKWTRKKLNLS